jgi:hypothetical protein
LGCKQPRSCSDMPLVHLELFLLEYTCTPNLFNETSRPNQWYTTSSFFSVGRWEELN